MRVLVVAALLSVPAVAMSAQDAEDSGDLKIFSDPGSTGSRANRGDVTDSAARLLRDRDPAALALHAFSDSDIAVAADDGVTRRKIRNAATGRR